MGSGIATPPNERPVARAQARVRGPRRSRWRKDAVPSLRQRIQGWLVVALTLAAPICWAAVEDRRWCRTTSDHFDLVTDLNERKSLALLLSLDRFRTAAYALLPGRPLDPPAAPRLLVFNRAQDFAALFEFPHIVGFTQPSLKQSLLAFGPDRGGRHLHAFAYHEYTHFLLRSRTMLNLPIWYEEGLASYLATLNMDSAGVVTVGRGPHALLRFLVKQPSIPVQQVVGERFRLDWRSHDLSDVYTLAWGIVRFLHHAKRADGSRYAEQLGKMLAAIDGGETTARAMRSELGIDPADLHRLMRAYFTAQDAESATVFRFKIDDYEAPSLQRDCLNAVETRFALAEAVAPHHPDKAAAFYDYVLARKRQHIGALLGRSRIADDLASALQDARAALEIASDDPAANVRLAQLRLAQCQSRSPANCATDLAEAATHYYRALATASHRADAAYGLGILYLHGGQPGEALEHLLAAHFRAPWSPRINFYLGEAYRRSGAYERARQHLEKTANWHPEEAWRDRAERALDAIATTPAAQQTNTPATN